MCCTLSTGIRRPVDAQLAKQPASIDVFSRRTSASNLSLQRRSILTFMTRGVTVNESSKLRARPLYLLVRDALLDRIKKGALKPGGTLPSEIDLYRELGVSLGTLRKALGVLEAEKLIIREPGRGTFVNSYREGVSVSPSTRYERRTAAQSLAT